MKKYSVMILLLLVCLISCSEEKEAVSEVNSVQDEVIIPETETPPPTAPSVPVEIEETEDTPKPENAEYSRTTGLPCTPEERERRPIAVMYNNLKLSYPQIGISKADIVYECNAEGGVTRLLAIFSDWEKLSPIGSIRSARDYYVSLSESHGAIFVNAGGSPGAYEKLKGEKVDYIDGVNMYNIPKNTFYRDNDRIKQNGYEHSMMTDGTRLMAAVKKLGYLVTYKDGFTAPYLFGEEAEALTGGSAMTMTLPHSNYITVRFDYDAESGKYLKYSFGESHIDGETSEQLTFDNVIVLFVKETVLDSAGRLKLDLTAGGSGYFMRDGKYIDIKWTRGSNNSPFVLTAEGEEITLKPGKTHITLFNKNRSNKVSIK